jgi:prepilin-type N-terminal cleavage/methylation domain-containing protein
MRPTGKRWLGHEKEHGVNSVSERIARRCGLPVFYSVLKNSGQSGPRRSLGRSNLSRRDYNPFGIKTFSHRSAGLSLIELLVVLTIIAAISALITTSVLSALNQQNQRICLNNMLTIEAAKDEYIRDHPGATSIDKTAFQQYFRFGIPTCPDQSGVEYTNLYSLTQTVTCSKHPQNDSKVSASPSSQ